MRAASSRISRAGAGTLLFALLVLPGGTAEAGMIETDGLEPWEICGLCHNLNGISRSDRFPHLAGQKAAYIRKQLQDFKAGRRSNDNGQMASIVEAELAEPDIPKVADYFAALTPPSPSSEGAKEQDLARGRALFETGAPERGIPPCARCHLASNPKIAHAPRITAQRTAYLAKQLMDFRSGARGNDATQTMSRIASRLSDAEIESVAIYATSQPRAAP
jgi:cytochrome c553